jgi:hypothetical protein
MNAVKGTKRYKMHVVRYRPYLRFGLWTLTTLLIVGGVFGSYWFGIYKGTELQAEAIEERDRLQIELSAKREEAENYRQQVANLNLGANVDRKANEGVRQEVIELKNQIGALEEDISFYRGLMSPNADKSGLTIGSLEILQTPVARTFEYKLAVQQLAANHPVLTGYLNFIVTGRQDGLDRVVHLKDLSSNVSVENIKLRFRYFQNFEGQLKLPEGFEPVRIELVAKSTGKAATTVNKKFGWLVQES